MAQTKKGYSATPSIRLNELAGPLLKRAEQENVKPAQVIRRALKLYLQDNALRIEDTAGLRVDLRALRAEFHRAGDNLNQLAHFFNVHDTLDTSELAKAHFDLRRQFWEARQLLEAVIEDLRKSA